MQDMEEDVFNDQRQEEKKELWLKFLEIGFQISVFSMRFAQWDGQVFIFFCSFFFSPINVWIRDFYSLRAIMIYVNFT